jgi:hypothetical protein
VPASSNTRRKALAGATGILAALVAGMLAALFGTLLHGQVAYAGTAPLPWGAVLALLLAASLAVIAGLYTERLWATALAGILTYVLVGWASLDAHNHLIVSWANHEALPGPALAGAVWMYGIVASTLFALGFTARTLRHRQD